MMLRDHPRTLSIVVQKSQKGRMVETAQSLNLLLESSRSLLRETAGPEMFEGPILS